MNKPLYVTLLLAAFILVLTNVACGGSEVAEPDSGDSEISSATGPDPLFTSDEELFKYGAIGLTEAVRVPYYIWKVMPEVCGEFMSGEGWESLGLLTEAGADLPIGFARRNFEPPVVELNCAVCHVGSYRVSADAPRQLAIGAPAHELDLRGYLGLYYRCAESDAFSVERVVAAIDRNFDLSDDELGTYREGIVPAAKQAFAAQRQIFAWHESRPPNGLGRTDTFNPAKLVVFRLPDDGTIGTVDFPAIYNQRLKRDMWLHWDGNNNDVRERNYAAAMAVGASPESVNQDHFNRIIEYIMTLEAPAYPGPIDDRLAVQGAELFGANCARCHAFDGDLTGQVTDIDEIGTDRHRLDSFTPELLEAFHALVEPPFLFDAFRKTNGYANVPLDGLWTRGPYLHNGSVPTVWDLLEEPGDRPTSFYTGYNVLDLEKLGFIATGPEAEAAGWHFDTSVPGNGNGGHLYGVGLTDAEKRALVEYLKTL